MISNMLLPLALLCVLGVEGSYYPTERQGWGPRYPEVRNNPATIPPKLSPHGYYSTRIGVNPYTSTGTGSVKGYNSSPSASGSAGVYYRNQQTDKSAYASAPVGKAFIGNSFNSRYSNNVHDPTRSRYNPPFHGPSSYGSYGSYSVYRNAGFYGVKSPTTGYSHPVNNAQAYRGSRIYDGSKAVPVNNPSKATGVYVIPTPSKLYYDGVKN